MSINKKIEEIRCKPEHIRIRYVWAGVLITMLFIVIIWLFSLGESFENFSSSTSDARYLKDQWNNTKENMPSIEEFMKSSGKELENETESLSEQGTSANSNPSSNN
jgi:hypothetical protein